MDDEPLIYREEVTSILIALADLVVDLHYIRTVLEGLGGEEEGDEEGAA